MTSLAIEPEEGAKAPTVIVNGIAKKIASIEPNCSCIVGKAVTKSADGDESTGADSISGEDEATSPLVEGKAACPKELLACVTGRNIIGACGTCPGEGDKAALSTAFCGDGVTSIVM